MKNTIEKYFIAFGYLSLPNIGTIKLEKTDAILENGIWNSPKETIVFETINEQPSKHFYTYLADALSISNDQAILKYEQFIQDLINNGNFQLGSLGLFQFNNQSVLFTPHYNHANYFDSIDIETVKNTDGNNNQIHSNKDNWYLWAIVIAVLATIAILIKNFN
jgi:hypothetical protein